MTKDRVQAVLDVLRELVTPEQPVYLVGGAVRDRLLSRPIHDLDFVMPGATRALAKEAACRLNGAFYVMDAARDTTRVIIQEGEAGERLILDFASLRAPDLSGDLCARDYTINALALAVNQPDALIDPTGGLADLREQHLRACSPQSIRADPVRVLRGVRLAVGLGLRIAPETLQQMKAAVPLLTQVSAERVRDEWMKILDGARVHLAVRLLDQIGALGVLLPELPALQGVTQSAPHTLDVWEHTLSVTRELEMLLGQLTRPGTPAETENQAQAEVSLWLGRFRAQFTAHYQTCLVPDRSVRPLLFFAALYHDIAKPATRMVSPAERIRFLGHDVEGALLVAQRASALALSVKEAQWLQTLVSEHMRVHALAKILLEKNPQLLVESDWRLSWLHLPEVPRRSVYRFFQAAGPAGVDLCLLSLADTRATYGVSLPREIWLAELLICRSLLEAYWEKPQEAVEPPRFLSGNDLMTGFGLAAGRKIGEILAAIREAQAVGEIHDRAGALQFAQAWLEQPSHGPMSAQQEEE